MTALVLPPFGLWQGYRSRDMRRCWVSAGPVGQSRSTPCPTNKVTQANNIPLDVLIGKIISFTKHGLQGHGISRGHASLGLLPVNPRWLCNHTFQEGGFQCDHRHCPGSGNMLCYNNVIRRSHFKERIPLKWVFSRFRQQPDRFEPRRENLSAARIRPRHWKPELGAIAGIFGWSHTP